MLDGGPERQETTTGGVTAEDAQAPQHCEGMDCKRTLNIQTISNGRSMLRQTMNCNLIKLNPF